VTRACPWPSLLPCPASEASRSGQMSRVVGSSFDAGLRLVGSDSLETVKLTHASCFVSPEWNMASVKLL
jgi:hypothetical protein